MQNANQNADDAESKDENNGETITARGNATVRDRTSKGAGLDMTGRYRGESRDEQDTDEDDGDERASPSQLVSDESVGELRTALARASKRGDRRALKDIETRVLPDDMPPQASEREKRIVATAVLHPSANLRTLADESDDSVRFVRMTLSRYLEDHDAVAKYDDEDTSGDAPTARVVGDGSGNADESEDDVTTSRTGRYRVPLPDHPPLGELTEKQRRVVEFMRDHPDEPLSKRNAENIDVSKNYPRIVLSDKWPEHPKITDADTPSQYYADDYDGETDGEHMCPECTDTFATQNALTHHRIQVHGFLHDYGPGETPEGESPPSEPPESDAEDDGADDAEPESEPGDPPSSGSARGDSQTRGVLEEVAQSAQVLARGTADENVTAALREALRPVRESDIEIDAEVGE